MTRPKFRRTLRLETLESRELLASGGPSAQQQYMLELLNLARTNPASVAERVTSNPDADLQATVKFYGVDLNQARSEIASIPAKPPLAWNDQLAAAAQGHSQDQANTGVQSHSGSDGSNLSTRLDRVGYTNRTTGGENAYAYSQSVDEAMEAFLIDWGVADHGHRGNIMQPVTPQDQAYREVGIGIVNTSKPSPVGPMVVTQNFGAQANAKPQLLGVAYNDPHNQNFYEPGQGRNDVTIDAVNEATGQKVSVQTWDSGGYQIPLDPGSYKVTAHVGDQIVKSQTVNLNTANVKVDYDLSEPWQGGSLSASTTPPPQAPAAPATTPAVQPVLMIQKAEPPVSTPETTPVAQADPEPVVLKADPAKTDAPAPVTISIKSSEPERFQAATDPDASTPALPDNAESFFNLSWVSWKAKKSA